MLLILNIFVDTPIIQRAIKSFIIQVLLKKKYKKTTSAPNIIDIISHLLTSLNTLIFSPHYKGKTANISQKMNPQQQKLNIDMIIIVGIRMPFGK